MGAYFSLRSPADWLETVGETPHPSIRTNVSFDPRHGHQLLLERPGRTQFSFPSGIRQDGDVLEVSNEAEASLLLGLDQGVGRLYAALLLVGPGDKPHRFRQAVVGEEQCSGNPDPPADGGDTARSDMFSTALSLERLCRDPGEVPTQDSEWRYMLFCTVKEGVLVYFKPDVESCEQVMCEIAASSQAGASGMDAASPFGVTLVGYPLGQVIPSAARLLADVMHADLPRRFAICCDVEAQAKCTNCVVFCLRALLAFQHSIKSQDVRRVCASRADLGPIAGEAVGAALEQLKRVVRP